MATTPAPASRPALPRVLHVAESARGGVGTYLAELLPEQARVFGAEHVRALVPAAHASHISGVDRHLLVPYRRAARSLTALVALFFALRREVATFRPTVIHAHSSFAGLVVRLACGWRPRDRRAAIVYCAHGWGFDRAGKSLANRVAATVERGLAAWCDRIVVISEHERMRAVESGIAAERLRLVLNGIADAPPAVPAQWDDQRLKLLFVGRLDRQKGIDVLLDAVEPLADRVALRIVGRAVADAEVERRLSRQVAYLGWRSLAEVSAEMAAADIVVVPSRWEGFGLVAVEAMRAGRAVVASRVGGLPEIVVDGVTGRLVSGDSPLELLRALSVGSRATWRRMGSAGRQRYLDRFTAARMADDLAAVYAELDDADYARDAPAVSAAPVLAGRAMASSGA